MFDTEPCTVLSTTEQQRCLAVLQSREIALCAVYMCFAYFHWFPIGCFAGITVVKEASDSSVVMGVSVYIINLQSRF